MGMQMATAAPGLPLIPAVWLALVFLSLWDLASTGFLIGFSVFCTDYGQYWFSNILRISRVLVFL